jgi:hypothetical protein
MNGEGIAVVLELLNFDVGSRLNLKQEEQVVHGKSEQIGGFCGGEHFDVRHRRFL